MPLRVNFCRAPAGTPNGKAIPKRASGMAKPRFADDPFWAPRFRMGRGVITAILAQSSKVDQLAGWTLGATSAIAALIIGNLEKVAAALRPGWQWWLLGGLGLSALSGVLQKLQNARVSLAVDLEERIYSFWRGEPFQAAMLQAFAEAGTPLATLAEPERAKAVHEKALELAAHNVEEVASTVPRWMRRGFRQGFEAGLADPLWALKAIGGWYWQVSWALLQLGCFAAALASVLFLLR